MVVIPVLSRYTTWCPYCGTIPHRRLDFFNYNKNNLVKLEDTTIKTERGCSMQRTEREPCITADQSRADFLHRGINFPNTTW